MRRLLTAVLLILGVSLSAAPIASAAEPPNQHDPCSRAGRDSCKTTGVGRYATYRYGLRWFGDYRGAVTGTTDPTFCIDLRFWYPSKSFGYKQRTTDGLKNRDGDKVAPTLLTYMNYALWTFGRTTSVTKQAATMLYVHHLMGDGAPGEIDPGAISPQIEKVYDQMADEAKDLAGPYRVEAVPSASLQVGAAGSLRVRVLSATNHPVPDTAVHLDVTGATGLPADLRTGDDGVASLPFTPTSATGLKVTATANGLAADAPKLFAPTKGGAVRSGQRLVSAAGTAKSVQATAAVAPAQVTVTTAATPQTLGVGGQSSDTVTVTGAPASWKATAEVRLYGPAASRAALTCTGAPAQTTSVTLAPGNTVTPQLTLTGTGWYGYVIVVPSTPDVTGTTTPCVPDAETVHVQSQPTVGTQISAQTSKPGDAIFDTVNVSGLAGETVTVNAALYGPFPSRDAIVCTGTPVWTGSFTAAKDGTYTTDKVTLTAPGYYTYLEGIPASDTVVAVTTACADAAETTVVQGAPAIHTQVSAATTAPGQAITDTAVVSGLGTLKAQVGVELWGPYASLAEMTCTGTPFWSGQFTANGDGSYQTEPVTLTTAGYYVYREGIGPTEAYPTVATACGEAAETTFAKAAPKVVTTVSDAVVSPGTTIADHLVVSGLGKTPATVSVELFGPFGSRADISCDGTPYWKGSVAVTGDGEYDTDEATVKRAGFYTFRERIADAPTITGTDTSCAEEAETSLAAPLIQTGRTGPLLAGAARATAPVDDARAPSGPRPTLVKYARLGISAKVEAVGIDTKTGELGVPTNIARTGWWQDGAAPGASAGSILIAGHVDSAKKGAGVFYPLKNAKKGDTIVLLTVDGKQRTYRVTGQRKVLKNQLPQSLFTRTGDRRLYLVTCGGPFNAKLGHYRDNVIVTAVPA
ncbi:MAG: sortase [Patulibacter sp.]|nr:sortase [Patulibacter sp.]